MRVHVRYFAVFRDAVGTDNEWVETAACSARELFAEMAARHPGLQHEPASLVAINEGMADWEAPFDEGDEILFFPPVAGG
jgi:MoaD family protein